MFLIGGLLLNEIVVPIDITQEEKSILAIFSLRQFLLVVPPGFFMIGYILWGSFPFVSGIGGLILRVLLFLLVTGSGVLLAYFKIEKYELYLSDYFLIRWRYKKSQKVYTNL